jgi:thioredoxin reductase (NADPH)
MTESIVLWLVAVAVTLGILWPYVRRHRKRELAARKKLQEARARGEEEPQSLHPVVNPSICIGTGECVLMCPEKDVLGIIGGQALPINQTHCVGHGLCERSCPVEAIQLVVGTATRGVDIPRIKENFETNVPGVYVVGELGGMGLIKNAFEQARQCVEGIVREKNSTSSDVLDAVVVGCGPAGLAFSLHALARGLRFVTIEREDIGGTVRYYPRKKLVMTSPLEIPGFGQVSHREIQKEDLVDLWSEIIEKTKVGEHIVTHNPFESASREDAKVFKVSSSSGTYYSSRIVLAVGRRGTPRKLGIPGEESSHVMYSLLEPERFTNDRITVVGGGDSAIEAAVALSEQPGNQVNLSYRKARFSRLKPRNQERIEQSVQSGSITFLPESNLDEIRSHEVVVSGPSAERQVLGTNYVFIFAGGTLATGMLKDLGVEIDTKFGEPLF